VAATVDPYLAELFDPVGLGVFRDGLMIALVADDVLYFKSDAETDPAFDAEGCEPFGYEASGRRVTIGSFRRAPERVFDDPDAFRDMALAAAGAALRSGVKKPAGRGSRRARR
jgi:DNA transformation protein